MKYLAKAALVVAGLCVLAAPSCAEDAGKPPIVPVTKAAFHLFTFQDDNMSLENVTLPPGA